jgi:anthranilate phosphoribosyltransferase
MKVTKHWNKASSGRFWSFDLIEKLWYKIPENIEEIVEEYEKNNIAFLYAKNLYPFFKEFAEVRKRYWRPTIFNIIWPLLNPANSDYQIIWCSFKDKMELMIETCKLLWRKNVLVVRWEDWLDEITLSDKTLVYELKNWEIKKYNIDPEDFWFKKIELSEIMSEEIEDKINIAKNIINWKTVWQYTNLIDLNIAVALKFLNK